MKKYEDISPAPLVGQNLVGNIVFSIPVAVIMSESTENMEQVDSFAMTLESLIHQPGIDPNNIYVFYNGSSVIITEIVEAFKFHLMALNIGDLSSENSC